MCGIAGMVLADGARPDRDALRAMTDCLAHRGPDAEGHYVEPGIGLGHRRLSIIDLSGGAQPMGSEDGHCQVVFNGEIYNFLALRPGLEARGHAFRTRSDTEVLVHLIEERGRDALPLLQGMFALAAWNSRTRELLLARDRAGKKPLYWFQDRAGFYFASEIKALLTLPNCPRAIDPGALDLYLTYDAIPGTKTIFRGVSRLPPASVLTIAPGSSPRIETYWAADWSRKTTLPYDEAAHQLRQLIVEATRARLVADVPLGAFLSGGVDSSIVVAAMAETSAAPVRTFSIGFPEADFDETRFARLVADRFATRHEALIVRPNAVEILPSLAWHYDQPFADSSALPTFYVSQLTRPHGTVALTGDGGDEFFGGYERYRALLVRALYERVTTRGVRTLAGRLAHWLPGGAAGGTTLGKIGFFADAASADLATFNRRLMYHRGFEAPERAALYAEDFGRLVPPAAAEAYFADRMIESAASAGGDPVDWALCTDTRLYLPDTLLVKVDIASMSVGLETRAPLLDTAVMEFAASLPRAWKVTRTDGKKILKDAFRDVLPGDVLDRRKMGFSIPLARWFRHDLAPYVREILLDARTLRRGYFKPAAVERLIDDHVSGRRNNAYRLWTLIMLEHWHREILERPRHRPDVLAAASAAPPRTSR
jgi:asparagine synthase (glutamine-hydrolysing)